MLFYKFKSDKQVNVNVSKYIINWNDSPSKEQKVLQDFLYPFWKHKVVLAEMRIPGSKFRVDLICLSDRVAIEYSPDSSHDYNPFFHKSRVEYIRRVKSDIWKIEELERNGFKVIEINKNDLSLLSRSFFVDKFGVLL